MSLAKRFQSFTATTADYFRRDTFAAVWLSVLTVYEIFWLFNPGGCIR